MPYWGLQTSPRRKKIQSAPDIDQSLQFIKSMGQLDIACFAEMLFETESGNSQLLDRLKEDLDLPFCEYIINGPCYDTIDEIQDMFYGQALLSRTPFKHYDLSRIQEPDQLDFLSFKNDHSKGTTGKNKHRKCLQKAIVNVDGIDVLIINVHGIPIHLFQIDGQNVSIDHPDLQIWRQEFVSLFDIQQDIPFIVAGDFNSAGMTIQTLLPNLFEAHKANNSIDFNNTTIEPAFCRQQNDIKCDPFPNDDYSLIQVDHIIASPHFKKNEGRSFLNHSDHPALYADLEMIKD